MSLSPRVPRFLPGSALRALFLVVLMGAGGVAPASAQLPRAWTPPDADSLLAWATEARTRFQTNTGDSVGGDNYRAYDVVSRMGRRLVHSLGRGRLEQALAIEGVLDSLGLDTDVAIDPGLPHFVLLMVRNPFRPSAAAVGFYYWYRGDDLRLQGALFRGGMNPTMRVWWTGNARYPYAWGVLDHARGEPSLIGLTLLRLDPTGYLWNLVQHPGDAALGGPGEAAWADINRDGVPEIVVWVKGEMDSTFDDCSGCPELILERTFVDRADGFRLEESRLLPTPFSNLVLFMRLLREGQDEAAARLLADPAMLEEAKAKGWARPAARSWRFIAAEPGERWPRWMTWRFRASGAPSSYNFRFAQRDGRWIIAGWESTASSPARPPSAGSP